MPNSLDHCGCATCAMFDPAGLTASLVQRAAVEALRGPASAGRPDCPRCRVPLGPTEIVVDSVGHAHKVQACGACLALWVTP